MRTRSPSELEIVGISARGIDIPLADRFTIARGSMAIAENVFVRVELRCGAVGYGECAPFPALTGEDRDGTLKAVDLLREAVTGHSAMSIRETSRLIAEAAPRYPAARCGLETAILDAGCRALGIPLYAYFGAATTQPQETDVTIPILGRERCLELARQWCGRGFRTLKVKAGRNLDSDIATIQKITRQLPDISFVIDGNQGFSESEAVVLIDSLKKSGVKVRTLEQPVDKEDLAALARLRSESPFPICADESVASRRDAVRVIKSDAADVINIKIMKCGVIEALDIALLTLASGLKIMIGGMVETRLAMGCSLAMAAGLGPVHTLDLDTPLLMTEDPLEGGYRYEGPMMFLSEAAGLGVTPKRQ